MKRKLAIVLGYFLVQIFPKRAKKLSMDGITIEVRSNIFERLMKKALLHKAVARNDFECIAKYHQSYWDKKGESYFEKPYISSILENFFIPYCKIVINLLKHELTQTENKYSTLIEIGTGDGSVLNYLSKELFEIKRFVGIDLSEEQVKKNNLQYKDNNKLNFVASDGFEWIRQHAKSNTVVLTSRGVLEYFTPTAITSFLKDLCAIGDFIFVAIEPTAVEHDFSKNPESQIYGWEKSFSHNYIKLFKDAHFKIWHHSTFLHSKDINFNLIGAKT